MAYGARLESVLGASPRGFESLSLRQEKAVCIYTGGFLLVEEIDLNPDKRVQGAKEPLAEACFETAIAHKRSELSLSLRQINSPTLMLGYFCIIT